jgi:hypothetical protein
MTAGDNVVTGYPIPSMILAMIVGTSRKSLSGIVYLFVRWQNKCNCWMPVDLMVIGLR